MASPHTVMLLPDVLVSPFSGVRCRVFAFVFGGGRPLSLAEKIEGLGRRDGKIDERNGAGEQEKQIKKLRMCDMSGSGEGGPSQD